MKILLNQEILLTVIPSLKLDQFDVDPHRAVFFEDTAKNLETAKTLGWSTVWIKADQDARQIDQTYEADLTACKIEQALDTILKFVE